MNWELNCGLAKLEREDLLKHVKEELICTIGSKCVPMTVPVIISLFREDTDMDLNDVCKKLGHPSIASFLHNEMSDSIIRLYTSKALGINENDQSNTLSFTVNPEFPRTKHVMDSIVMAKNYRDEQKERRHKFLQNDPQFSLDVIVGKSRIYLTLDEIGGSKDYISYQKLQQEYLNANQVALDRTEIKKYFRKTHIKSVVRDFMYDDIDVKTDANQTGSLFFKLKRPLDEIITECENAMQIRCEENRPKKKKKKKKQASVPPPPPKPKREKIPPPPKRERIPPPPPKEKKQPELKPLIPRPERFYTNDIHLAQIAVTATNNKGMQPRPYLTMNENLNSATSSSTSTAGRNVYTKRVDGAKYTSSENDECSSQHDETSDEDESEGNVSTSENKNSSLKLAKENISENDEELNAINALNIDYETTNQQLFNHDEDIRLRYKYYQRKNAERKDKLAKYVEEKTSQFEVESKGRKRGIPKVQRKLKEYESKETSKPIKPAKFLLEE